jgi:hypothetical protein
VRRPAWPDYLLAVLIATAWITGLLAVRARGAISQVDRLYACVLPDGSAHRIGAYEPLCRRGHVVTWSVKPTGGSNP